MNVEFDCEADSDNGNMFITEAALRFGGRGRGTVGRCLGNVQVVDEFRPCLLLPDVHSLPGAHRSF